MAKDYILEEYINNLSEDNKENFYRKCFYIVINSNYNYNDKRNYEVDTKYLNNRYLNYYSYRYFEEYATEEERKYYQSNPVLEEKLKISKEYFILVTKQQQLEYIYNYCLKVNWSYKRLTPISMALNTDNDAIKRKAIKYAIEYLGIKEEEIRKTIDLSIEKNKIQNNINSKYNKIFKKMYMAKNNQELINILQAEKVVISHMLNRVIHYVELYKDELDKTKTEKEIIADLTSKIKYYDEYKKESLKNEKTLKRTQANLEKEFQLLPLANTQITKLINYILANQLIDSLENIEKIFCENEKISEKDLKKYKEVIEKHNQKLYIEYFHTTRIAKKLRDKQMLITALSLRKILVKEIISESSPRSKFNFDSIDYYNKFDIPLTELCEKIDKLSVKLNTRDIKLIKHFTHPYYFKRIPILTDKDINMILNETTERRCVKDKNGMPISGTGIILTKEEKIQILNYLKENNIPEINRNVYNDACEKYIDGKLFKLTSKTKKLKNI